MKRITDFLDLLLCALLIIPLGMLVGLGCGVIGVWRWLCEFKDRDTSGLCHNCCGWDRHGVLSIVTAARPAPTNAASADPNTL